jgi:hypothetical protein
MSQTLPETAQARPASSSTGHYSIRLKIPPAAREDAWDWYRVAIQCGGREIRCGCFAFPDEERWLEALETLRHQFGIAYCETLP